MPTLPALWCGNIAGMNRYTKCPCDKKDFYQKCCGRYHHGALAEDALTLMRSRFSAYALGQVEYIADTTHVENPGYGRDRARWLAELRDFSQNTKFLYLTILSFEDAMDTAFVTFTAHLSQSNQDATFTEKSTFLRENGRWFYRSGEVKSGN